jgi:hydrogenase expression/formation protein HypC
MCLAKPMKLVTIQPDGIAGAVDAGGVKLPVNLILVPEAKVGDYVLVHAGSAIEVLEEQDARAILEAYDEFVLTGDSLAPEAHRPDEN